jgi:hypothetical protein
MGGELRADSLAVSLLNLGANKLDYFVREAVDLTVEPTAAGSIVRLTIHLDNPTPTGQSGYVAGPSPALAGTLRAGDYRGMLAVTLPGGSAGVTMAGVDKVDVQGPDGPTRVVGATVILRRGESKDVRLQFTLPGNVGSMLIEPSARVPAAEWHYGPDSWQDDRPRTANW